MLILYPTATSLPIIADDLQVPAVKHFQPSRQYTEPYQRAAISKEEDRNCSPALCFSSEIWEGQSVPEDTRIGFAGAASYVNLE